MYCEEIDNVMLINGVRMYLVPVKDTSVFFTPFFTYMKFTCAAER